MTTEAYGNSLATSELNINYFTNVPSQREKEDIQSHDEFAI
jgi:hypothetical protein